MRLPYLIGCCGEQNNENALALYDICIDAGANFGFCDLHIRQSERWEAVGIMPNSASEYRDLGMHYQTLGLNQLSQSHELLNALQENIESGTQTTDTQQVREFIDEIQFDFRRQICQLEIKAADVIRIEESLSEAFGIARQRSFEQLTSYCRERLDQLYEVRSREDRGLIENIPWWKALLIGLVIGFAIIWIVYECVKSWKNCIKNASSSGQSAYKIGQLIAKLC